MPWMDGIDDLLALPSFLPSKSFLSLLSKTPNLVFLRAGGIVGAVDGVGVSPPFPLPFYA